MAKELPYFRFTASEWQNGHITFESMESQGVFINACSYYWISNCCISEPQLKMRLSGNDEIIENLIDKGILKVVEGYIVIAFLDKQWNELLDYRKKRQIAGRKGGLTKSSRARVLLKQKPSYKDKDNDKEKSPSRATARLEILSEDEITKIDKRIERAKNGEFN